MAHNDKVRTVIFYREYYWEFYYRQTEKIRRKINKTLELVEQLPRIPENYFKHMEGTDGLYEIRVQHGSNAFRIFCCFDEGRLVVLLNGFQKKSQKTPRQEIEKALQIKKEYENEKNEHHHIR
jgi:phage-related protein